MPFGPYHDIPQTDPRGRVNPRFWHHLIRFRHFIDGSLALASPSPADPGMLPGLGCNAHHHGFLTTAACSGLRSAHDCRPRRALLHLLHSCAQLYGPTALVTHDPQQTSATTDCLQRNTWIDEGNDGRIPSNSAAD